MTLADRIDHVASQALLDAFAGDGICSAVLLRRAYEIGVMLWASRSDADVQESDVQAIGRWLRDEWSDWLALRLYGQSAELRIGAGRLLDTIGSLDGLDLDGVARFVYALYCSDQRRAVEVSR